MKFSLPLTAIALAGCATAQQMVAEPPQRIYHSTRPRSVIAECLMDRLASQDIVPEKQDSAISTTVSFIGQGGLARPKPAIYVFQIIDVQDGERIEAHAIHGIGSASLLTAETCF